MKKLSNEAKKTLENHWYVKDYHWSNRHSILDFKQAICCWLIFRGKERYFENLDTLHITPKMFHKCLEIELKWYKAFIKSPHKYIDGTISQIDKWKYVYQLIYCQLKIDFDEFLSTPKQLSLGV